MQTRIINFGNYMVTVPLDALQTLSYDNSSELRAQWAWQIDWLAAGMSHNDIRDTLTALDISVQGLSYRALENEALRVIVLTYSDARNGDMQFETSRLEYIEGDLLAMALWVKGFFSRTPESDIAEGELDRLESAVESLRDALLAIEDTL